MRAIIPFDTLEYMEELRESGMDMKQAEAITKANAKAFNEMVKLNDLATKQDIKELESSTKKDLKEMEILLRKEIKELEITTKKDLQELELKLSEKISSSMWKTVGMIIAMQALFAGFSSWMHFLNLS